MEGIERNEIAGGEERRTTKKKWRNDDFWGEDARVPRRLARAAGSSVRREDGERKTAVEAGTKMSGGGKDQKGIF
jgi:hypothetical protein